MRAYWLDDGVRGEALPVDVLRTEEILYERLPLDAFQAPLDALKRGAV